ncbi:hypothetical protein GCM10027271_17550 [Saccharopolyspora gloriosae]|uniref:Uncharacterized protein n=1 Tax=Saccharopolyspora gloriosae TaxID=455344 RepID=A0A840NAZ7_9PSEU|nr:hypothetical protein [Saccharopolyspora gloriosae]
MREEDEATLDVARGDVALSKHLKNSLGVLRDKVDDPNFKRLVDDVLAGKQGLRDAFTSDAFSAALDPLVRKGAEDYDKLSEQERSELAKTGEQQFAELREQERTAAPPNRSRPEVPEEDEDFSQRSWLE